MFSLLPHPGYFTATVLSPPNSISTAELIARGLAIMILIAINAFFVMAEFAVVSVRRSRISQLVDAGDVQAKTVQELQDSLDRLLSTTQLGITLSSLALGWISERAMAQVVANWLASLPLDADFKRMAVHSLAIPIAFFSIAYLQIVLGELCPKSLALLYSEEIARFVAPVSIAIGRLFNPFIWVLNQSTRFLLRMGGIKYTGQGWYNQVSAEELQLIIASSTEASGIEADERELLSNVFEFGEVQADEIMVRRPQMIAIDKFTTVRSLLEEVAQSRHSRYIAIDESLDDIVGIIQLKDLADPLVSGRLTLDEAIAPWVQPVTFVPESTPLDELLTLMQQSGQHMSVVVDEFGSTAGLVTLQDLISQIIGETPEIGHEAKEGIERLDANTAIVQAHLDVEDINEDLGLELPITGEYRSLGGLLFYQWQRIPSIGETLQYGDCELTLLAADGPRLQSVRIHRLEPVVVESSPAAGAIEANPADTVAASDAIAEPDTVAESNDPTASEKSLNATKSST
ncbi:HlyC/CorC family transporter [filamentous cyanobacterium LEGE 11480]|uniref:HlyC/CorC family transporter n=1 Tax=Romeriopsis navalis LEGE 11480 TaxID=2777977 RepID=A0A928VS05_9CYAN|nr:hemolysin family protein [Romeriopsis navalis]MBE9031495.1 HlyC/CorC family transporter [Romeriopsis navalis LEGE 11480]